MRVGLSSRFHFAFALSLLFVCSLVHAANVIIDDTFGDPTNGVKIVYAPDIWNFGPKCTSCTAKPDPSQAYLETWDDTSQFGNFASVNATVSFTGTAVAAYGILDLTTNIPTDLTFFIDGQNKSTYFYLSDGPDAGEDYLYHVQFFSIDSLSPGPHTLVIQVGDKEAGRNSVILLDYITYSPLDEPTSTSSSSSPTSTCSSPAAQSTSISNIIDDTNGDPTGIAQIAYSPEGWWTAGLTCKGCTSHPDPALTYEDGWRDASQFGSPGGPAVTATITFSGSAISVYGVLDQAQVVPTDLTFILDGQTGCPFLFQTADATAQPEYLYNVLMFSADSLAAGPHTLVIQVGDAETSRHSVILLDYITYIPVAGDSSSSVSMTVTSQPSSASQTSTTSSAPISIATPTCTTTQIASPTSTGATLTAIDDNSVEPVDGAQIVYSPSWGFGPDCLDCFSNPDPSLTSMGTWHDTFQSGAADSVPINATAVFSGTSVALYGILDEAQTVATDLTFFLDDEPVGCYYHLSQQTNVSAEARYIYNVLFFSADSLTSGPHTLLLQVGNPGWSSAVLLDYATYSAIPSIPRPPTCQTTSTDTAAIPRVTLDDNSVASDDAQIEYSSSWGFGPDCTDCFSNPDPSLTSDGTWHDTFQAGTSSSPINVTVKFSGSAISIFGILDSAETVPTDLTFFLDGATVGCSYFNQNVEQTSVDHVYTYNVPFFSVDSLPPGPHTLFIEVGDIEAGRASAVMLDYFTYAPISVVPTAPTCKTSDSTPTGSAEAPLVTLDDNSQATDDAHIVYSASWGFGPDCTDCFSNPDPTLTSDGTWHDTFQTGDSAINATVTFSGTSISVYGILDQAETVPTDLTFFLDGDSVGCSYIHQNDQQSSNSTLDHVYTYTVLFFSVDSLSSGPHSLFIQVGATGRQSAVMLDYFTYVSKAVAPIAPTCEISASTPTGTTAAPLVTLDDNSQATAGAQIVYSSSWGFGPDCTDCFSNPDPSLTSSGTWHDTFQAGSSPINLTVTFSGTAVSVYGILDQAETVPTDLTFFLDGDAVGCSYVRQNVGPSSNTTVDHQYTYNVLFFSVDSLALGSHSLFIQVGAAGRQSAVMLDYITYVSMPVAPTAPTCKAPDSTPTGTAERPLVTLDDNALATENAHIVYSDSWGFGPDCTNCFSNPDPALTVSGTWHDTFQAGTASINATVTFSGTSISVYGILDEAETVATDLTFLLDGDAIGCSYIHQNPPQTSNTTVDHKYTYNVLFFSVDSLSSGSHSLFIEVGATGRESTVMLDYFTYVSTPVAPMAPTCKAPDSTPAGTADRPLVTFDDNSPATENAQIVYSDSWGFGPVCTNCFSNPDSKLTSSGTWHDTFQDGTLAITATVTFSGTAISVYGILDSAETVATDLTFLLDGAAVGCSYIHQNPNPTVDHEYTYNVLFFSVDSLSSGSHTLLIEVGGIGRKSTVMLDYFTYVSTPVAPTAPTCKIPDSTPTGTADTPLLTLDDNSQATDGAQIVYSKSWGFGPVCTNCFSNPDPSLTSSGTWHDTFQDGTSAIAATVTFSGTAISVYGILDSAETVPTDLTFFLDGSSVGCSYIHKSSTPSIDHQYTYNVLFFSVDSLSPGSHTLFIEVGGIGQQSTVMLDYFTYVSTPVAPTAPTCKAPDSTPTGTADRPLVTFDDNSPATENAQIVYSDSWGFGPVCTICFSNPDPKLTSSGTWHDTFQDGTLAITATVTFSGTAISVYGILDSAETVATDLTFFLDGSSAGCSYIHQNSAPTVDHQYTYNVLFFSVDSLSSGSHTLIIEVGGTGRKSTVMLDYFTYVSTPVAPTAPTCKIPHSTPTGTADTPLLTLDDNSQATEGAQIVYSKSWGFGPVCTTCFSNPDPKLTSSGTWHDTFQDGTSAITATVTFSGTAISVYGILDSAETVLTELTFFLDGSSVGCSYIHKSSTPSVDHKYTYNVLFFSIDSLSPGSHTLFMEVGGIGQQSTVMLDYFTYVSLKDPGMPQGMDPTLDKSKLIIDDNFGDPVNGGQIIYSADWAYGPTCTACTEKPDVALVYKGSWHDTSQLGKSGPINATISFTGTSVAVYGVLDTAQGIATDLTFILDGKNMGRYLHKNSAPTALHRYSYNIQFFSADSLKAGPHSLVMQVGGSGEDASVLLDFVMYTPTAPSKPQDGSDPTLDKSKLIIDDNFGDLVNGAKFTYSNNWAYGPECPACTEKPDVALVYKGSWHDTSNFGATSQISATIAFYGTSITVYGVLDTAQGTPTDLTFILDGKNMGRYLHENIAPTLQHAYSYNIQFFSAESLEAGPHSLVVQVGGNGGDSSVLLDYATYTPTAIPQAPDPTNDKSMAIIDDNFGDLANGGQIVYSGGWAYGPKCDLCTAKPDPSLVYNGSWHDTSQFGTSPPINATVSFSGTSVSVYGVLDRAQMTPTALTFILDGKNMGNYLSQNPVPTEQHSYLYNVKFFSADSLTAGPHSLVIQVGDLATRQNSTLLLDYIMYKPTLVIDPTKDKTKTILDDTFGDPVYGAQLAYSADDWAYGPNCTACSSKPDPARTYNGSWHDTSQFGKSPSINATISFSGTSVGVYGILDSAQGTPTDLTFILDGKNTTRYLHENVSPTKQHNFVYNVPFFTAESLSPGPHTLYMQVGDAEAKRNSVLLLDYIAYTAVPTNTTTPNITDIGDVKMDDTYGDPAGYEVGRIVYSPVGIWSYGPNCSTCSAKPDASKAYMGSWRDSSQFGDFESVNATVVFSGTSVAVYGIIDKSQAVPTDLVFTIDGQNSTRYLYENNGTLSIDAKDQYLYNVQFFSAQSLSAEEHVLRIQVGDSQGKRNSVILLDYVSYKSLSSSSGDPGGPKSASAHSASSSRTSIIVGAVLGTLAFIAVVVLSVLLIRKRRAKPLLSNNPQNTYSRI